MSRLPSYPLEDPEELRAIASPVRQRVVSGLEALGTASVRDLAAHLGRSPESLYFHLRKLIRHGLVEDVGERPAGRRTERLYRLVAARLRVAGDLDDSRFRGALAAVCRSAMRATERDYCRALEAGTARLHGRGRNLALHHYHVHLKPADRQHVVKLLEELVGFVIERNDPEHGELHSLTATLAPVARRRGTDGGDGTCPPAPPSP
jgi:predicted ArsR family transcriptional regulator